MSTVSPDRPTRLDGRTTPDSRLPAGRTLPLAYTFTLAAVLLAATGYGLLVEGAYAAPEGVRPTLPETLRGQDLVTMVTAVALVWGGIRARAGSLAGHIVWLAVCLYVPYTYLMYVVARTTTRCCSTSPRSGWAGSASSTGCSASTPAPRHRRSSGHRDGRWRGS
jgi:hypothetical protein